MKEYVKVRMEKVSFLSDSAIAGVSLDEYLTANGRDEGDIVNLGSFNQAS